MLLLLFISHKLLTIAHRFGVLAFIGLGLVDSSVIPLPGSMDALAIILAASDRKLWWHYALMATAGEVIGGFINYRVALRAGRAGIEKELGQSGSSKRIASSSGWDSGRCLLARSPRRRCRRPRS